MYSIQIPQKVIEVIWDRVVVGKTEGATPRPGKVVHATSLSLLAIEATIGGGFRMVR